MMGITPDAEYPLIFLEKGMTSVIGGCKNPEQGEIKVLEFQGGTASNIVPLTAVWYWKASMRSRTQKELRSDTKMEILSLFQTASALTAALRSWESTGLSFSWMR